MCGCWKQPNLYDRFYYYQQCTLFLPHLHDSSLLILTFIIFAHSSSSVYKEIFKYELMLQASDMTNKLHPDPYVSPCNITVTHTQSYLLWRAVNNILMGTMITFRDMLYLILWKTSFMLRYFWALWFFFIITHIIWWKKKNQFLLCLSSTASLL